MLILLLFLQLYPLETLCVADLKYFETFSDLTATKKVKRFSDGTKKVTTYVSFRAFERYFDITLQSDTHLLADEFTASLVHEDGSLHDFHIDRNTIFSGYLTEDPSVRVYAHTDHSLWLIRVHAVDNIYVIEPANRILNSTENPNNDTMVAYRSSDMKSDNSGSRTCGVKDRKQSYFTESLRNTSFKMSGSRRSYFVGRDGRSRKKRTIQDGGTCKVFLVADYTFYKGTCQSSDQMCSKIMYSLIDFADDVFTKTVFDDGFHTFTNVGIRLAHMLVYPTFTQKNMAYNFLHFNEHIKWTMIKKLEAFAIYASYMSVDKVYCLSHLLSHYAYPGNVLGYSYIGHICGKAFVGKKSENTAITSDIHFTSGPASNLQMNLVFCHELGHIFGSEHDPQNEECSRDDNLGGHFLMWPNSVNGKLENHDKFSPCSRRSIAGTLYRSGKCLKHRNETTDVCGNGILDTNEECDSGYLGISNADPCCDNECRLKPSALCSPVNYGCCENCTNAPKGKLCQDSKTLECKEASYCTGNSFVCPDPENSEDGITCINQGKCYRGICQNICELESRRTYHSLKECQCTSQIEACKFCCSYPRFIGKPLACHVFSNETLSDGTPCYKGTCQNGVCEGKIQGTIAKIILDVLNVEHSKVTSVMKANIVISVVVMSLLVWIPSVYFINKSDAAEKRESHATTETESYEELS